MTTTRTTASTPTSTPTTGHDHSDRDVQDGGPDGQDAGRRHVEQHEPARPGGAGDGPGLPRLVVHPQTGMVYRRDGDGPWSVLDVVRELGDDEAAALASEPGGWVAYEPPRTSGGAAGAPVVTVCGSMRFALQMLAVAAELTAAGEVVLAPFVTVAPADQDTAPELKQRLDRLHREKIAMADRVVVVSDRSGYYGASTTAEIAYADRLGVPVEYRRVAAADVDVVSSGHAWTGAR